MQDNNGQTPLHFAAKFGHQQIVGNIISWCKQTINISDKQKVTPFVQAVVSGHFDVSLSWLGINGPPVGFCTWISDVNLKKKHDQGT